MIFHLSRFINWVLALGYTIGVISSLAVRTFFTKDRSNLPEKYRNIVKHWAIRVLRLLSVDLDINEDSLRNLGAGDYEIVLASHKSHIDIIVLLAIYPLNKIPIFAAKQELFKVPFLRFCLLVLNAMSVDREKGSSAFKKMKQAIVNMDKTHSPIFYPEGTRSPGDKLADFKKGAFLLALETQRTLLPICISGTQEILEKGRILPNPGTVSVVVLPATPPPTGSGAIEATVRDIRERMNIYM